MPLSAGARSAWAAWGRRLLAGSWTHGGYLNWDTGLGFARWHQAKKLALAQLGLLGLAETRSLGLDLRWSRWAKWIFDRGLIFYDRQLGRTTSRVPKPLFFGVHAQPQSIASARLAAARMAANAARAIDAGLGAAPAERPPSLYSYDPDTGRLAVTTPAYNTAIIAVNGGAFPYGGLDLARLYDGDQEVAAGIGGRPPASFGLLVRDRAGRVRLATQLGSRHVTRRTPLILTRAPAGTGARASSAHGRAYAGPFTDLRATGLTTRGGVEARSSYRFTRDWIEGRWTMRRAGARGPLRAEALFPSTGGSARVVAILHDGSRVDVGGHGLALAAVDHLEVRSTRSGYVVRPLARPAGAWVRTLRPSAQSSAPNAGPTLAIRIADGSASRAAFGARITVMG